MWKNVLLVLFGSLLALLIGEGMVRLFVDEEYDYPRGLYLPDNTRGYWLTPGFCGSHRQINGDFFVNYCINNNGYRNSGPLHPISTTDILVLGDSFSFGVGVEDNETFASQISTISGLHVTNSAISGYDVPSAINALDVALDSGARPSVVILGLYLGNDLLTPDSLPAAECITAIDGFTVSKSRLNSKSKLNERKLRYYIRIYGFLASRLTQLVSASTLHTIGNYQLSFLGLLPEKYDMIFYRLRDDITQLKKHYLQKVQNGRFIILSIPTKFQVEAPFRDEICHDLNICPQVDKRIASINLLNDIGKQLDIPIIDMFPIFMKESSKQKDEFYFYHNDHWNAKSHKLAAEMLWQEIQKGL